MIRNDRHRGFTLFEIILVMLVIMAMVVAMITYVSRQTQESAADQLGYRLFQYGIAVSDYARQNPDLYDPSNLPETQYGYEWLQNKTNPETNEPFLGEDFSFDIRPLKIQDVETDGDDQDDKKAIKTVFSVNQTGQGSYELVVDLIELGLVMRPTTANQQGQTDESFAADPSLAGAAAKYATDYRGREGSAVILYHLDDDFADNPAKAHIVGELKQDTGLSDYWLRTDGGNQMQGPIEFNSTVVPLNRAIKGVESIDLTNQHNAAVEFRGFRFSAVHQITVTREEEISRLIPGPNAANVLTSANSVCYLVRLHKPQNARTECEVNLNNNGEWRLRAQMYNNPNQDLICSAQCMMFDWR